MKLEFLETPVKRSSKFKEEQFGIGDVRVIFEILRSKMYPVPIKSFTQEIMCNGRDAHREVGKPDVPIVVKMPTSFDRTFSVRDYGVGVGPERMSNVFIKYGASTKRDSNDQTGGFGLGAKSPWAYTDTFGITTWTPDGEDGQMIKREYIAYIDETRIGKLSLMTEEASTEKQGTMITVACKPSDESSFVDWVKATTEYWEVRPTIKGVEMKWDNIPKAFEGAKWNVLERESYMGQYTSYSRDDKAKAIVDGIPYTLQWANLKLNQWDGDLKRISQALFNVPLRMEFSIGEIQLSANREEIDYQESCIEVIQNRLKAIIKEFRKTIDSGIADSTDLWEANLRWQQIKSNFKDIFDTASWTDGNGQSHVLTGERIFFGKSGCTMWSFSRPDYGNSQKFKKERWNTDRIRVQSDWKFCINDDTCERPNRRRLTTLFDADGGTLKGVNVIMLPLEPLDRAEALKILREDFYVDLLQPTYLSTVVKAPIQRATGGTSVYTVTKAYRWQGDTYRRSDRWEKLTSFDITTGSQVYVTVVRGEAYLDDATTKNINTHNLQQIYKYLGVDVYGVPKRSVGKVGSQWVTLVDAVKAKYDEMIANIKVDKLGKVADDTDYILSYKYSQLKFLSDAANVSKLATDSLLKEYIDKCTSAQAAQHAVMKLEQFEVMLERSGIHTVIKRTKDTYDFKRMCAEVENMYPLLSMLQGWGKNASQKNAIIEYVNMMDSRNQKKVAKTPGKVATIC